MSHEEMKQEIIEYTSDELLSLKKQNSFNQLSILSLSEDTIKLATTWYAVTRKVVTEPIGNRDLHVSWQYTWFDAKEWSIMSGVPYGDVFKHFSILAKMNAIYADGTLAEGVVEYLRKELKEMMDTKENKKSK